MKVLLATTNYPTPDRPSAGIFVRNQYRFFCRHATPQESFSLFRVHTHAHHKPYSRRRALWATLKFIPQFFKQYDIIHIHSLSGLLRLACWYKRLHPKTRLILTLHGNGLRDLEGLRKAKAKGYRKHVKQFDEIILSGNSLLPMLQTNLGVENCRIICAGVDDLRFHMSEKKQKDFDFIFVGSFTKEKGVDVLLGALNTIEDEELRVCFVGSGPLEQDLKRAGHHLDIQVFVDVPQPRLRQLYCASKFLVFPSRGDGFGLVVTEAMYCGVPAIIYSDSGAEEQIQNNLTGLSYKPNTPEKLSRVLRSAYNMDNAEYERLCDNASTANLEYSLSHVGTKLMRLYRQISAEKDLDA